MTERSLEEWDALCARASEEYKDSVYTEREFKEKRDAYLASLIMQHRSENPDASEKQLENMAKGSLDWENFINLWMENLRKSGALKIKYENAKRRWSTQQSILSMKKAELNRFGSE